MRNDIERAQQIVQLGKENGSSGIKIAEQLYRTQFQIKIAEQALNDAGFFAQIDLDPLTHIPVLHVSEGIVMQGIVTLILSLNLKKLHSIEWY